METRENSIPRAGAVAGGDPSHYAVYRAPKVQGCES